MPLNEIYLGSKYLVQISFFSRTNVGVRIDIVMAACKLT
jgi:hypothetical protein